MTRIPLDSEEEAISRLENGTGREQMLAILIRTDVTEKVIEAYNEAARQGIPPADRLRGIMAFFAYDMMVMSNAKKPVDILGISKALITIFAEEIASAAFNIVEGTPKE